MDHTDDEPRAFPQVDTDYDDSAHEYTGRVHSTGGMSLRDYFAASIVSDLAHLTLTDRKAAEALHSLGGNSYAMGVAKMAYQMADAMLEARKES